MSKLHPHLRFNDGKCREAMNFYKDIFDGKLEISTGADMMRDKAKVGDNVNITIECDSQKQVDDYFAKLSKGGDVFIKPEKMFWGGYYGVVTDKYCFEWSLHFMMEPAR